MTENTIRADRTKRVLFVCTANVCRSPMAEAIFDALASDVGLPYEARSAGVRALVGDPMTPYAVAVLEEVGVYPGKHRAKQVDGAMIEEADLVLGMNVRHVEALRRLSVGSSEKIHTLPAYGSGAPEREGITDPYGQSMGTYRASMRWILECVELLVARLTVEFMMVDPRSRTRSGRTSPEYPAP